MSVDFAAIAEEAAAALAEVGTTVTILARGPETGPDYAPTFGPDVEHSASAVIGSFSAAEQRDNLVQIGDRKLTVQASGLDHVPTTADRVRIGGDVFTVIMVKALAPANEPVTWTLQVRQA